MKTPKYKISGDPIKHAIRVHYECLEGWRDEVVTLEMTEEKAQIFDRGAAVLAHLSGVPLEAAKAAFVELWYEQLKKTHRRKKRGRR